MQRKWVAVSHRMVLHEVTTYPMIMSLEPSDKVLQNAGVVWGAAVLGQLDVALAFGCTVCVMSPAYNVVPCTP